MNDETTDLEAGECSYETFGVRFFEYALTTARIESALSGLTGRAIDFGPKTVGTAGIAKISATGAIGKAAVIRTRDRPLTFQVTIPIDLKLKVRLAGRDQRFRADVKAGLALTVHAAKPLRLVIHAEAPTAQNVEVILKAEGLGASMLNAVAGIDGELRKVVARQIARKLDDPEMRKMRDIDIAARIDKATAK